MNRELWERIVSCGTRSTRVSRSPSPKRERGVAIEMAPRRGTVVPSPKRRRVVPGGRNDLRRAESMAGIVGTGHVAGEMKRCSLRTPRPVACARASDHGSDDRVSTASRPVASAPGSDRYVSLVVAASIVLLLAGSALAQTGGTFDLTWNTVDGGGTSSGGTFELTGTVGQADAGAMSGGTFDLAGGFPAGAAPGGCVTAADCDDADACTADTCDPADPGADAQGCVHTCVPVPYGDIWPRSKGGDGLVEVSDVLCVLAANNGNPDDGPSSPNTAPLGDCGTAADNDVFPCPPGNDGLNEVGDLTAVLAASDGDPPCADPCVCP